MSEVEYDDKAIRFLEILWGDAFLSPGGSEEVDRVIAGIDFTHKKVVDIGCGSGGITCYLAQSTGLAEIIGFDVEQPVLECAKSQAVKRGLSARVSFVHGSPGSLPFDNQTFNIVFSKDAMVHVADKKAIFRDIFRVLKPGGWFVASDWLTSHDGEPSALMKEYLAAEGLSFGMASATRYQNAMQAAGLQDVETLSRNQWYIGTARAELARLRGELYEQLSEAVGSAYVDKNIHTWEAMLAVLERGEHCPTHLRGRKPEESGSVQ